MNDSVFRFLSVDDVIELHAMQLGQYGGASGIRARGLLESAVMMPQASFGGDFVHKGIYKWQPPMLFILQKTNHL